MTKHKKRHYQAAKPGRLCNSASFIQWSDLPTVGLTHLALCRRRLRCRLVFLWRQQRLKTNLDRQQQYTLLSHLHRMHTEDVLPPNGQDNSISAWPSWLSTKFDCYIMGPLEVFLTFGKQDISPPSHTIFRWGVGTLMGFLESPFFLLRNTLYPLGSHTAKSTRPFRRGTRKLDTQKTRSSPHWLETHWPNVFRRMSVLSKDYLRSDRFSSLVQLLYINSPAS